MMRTSMVSKGQKATLCLESLEGRDVPANLVWTAAGDGVSWSDSDNWAEFSNGSLIPSGTPTSSDTLFFGSLGGANVSSVVDADFTVEGIVQNNTYTGGLAVAGGSTLTVTEDITAYGAIDLTPAGAELVAGSIFLIGGDIAVATSGDSDYTPITANLLDMVNGATLIVSGDPEEFATLQVNLTMGTGTTFRLFSIELDVTVDGSIGTSGTVRAAGSCTLTVTGNYSQPAGDLYLASDSDLIVEGTSPANLSGHTIAYSEVVIKADTVEVNGDGVMEFIIESDADRMTIDGDFDLAGGTFKFTQFFGILAVTGDLDVFVGTLDMKVAGSGVATSSDIIVVDGSVDLGTDVGGPTLILDQLTTITPPTTFSLIFSGETGTGEFFSIEADNTVLAQGWNVTNDVFQVTL